MCPSRWCRIRAIRRSRSTVRAAARSRGRVPALHARPPFVRSGLHELRAGGGVDTRAQSRGEARCCHRCIAHARRRLSGSAPLGAQRTPLSIWTGTFNMGNAAAPANLVDWFQKARPPPPSPLRPTHARTRIADGTRSTRRGAMCMPLGFRSVLSASPVPANADCSRAACLTRCLLACLPRQSGVAAGAVSFLAGEVDFGTRIREYLGGQTRAAAASFRAPIVPDRAPAPASRRLHRTGQRHATADVPRRGGAQCAPAAHHVSRMRRMCAAAPCTSALAGAALTSARTETWARTLWAPAG
jgi:hypothetical protein